MIAESNGAGKFVLALNAGSSSLKFALFRMDARPERVLSGVIEGIGQADTALILKRRQEPARPRRFLSACDHASGLDIVQGEILPITGAAGLSAVGHRVAHGGPRYSAPQQVTAELLDELRHLCPLAPEHLPVEIELIEAVHARFPELRQIVCFDTAFHRDLPRVARVFPIPRSYERAGVRRYGFHGLSYQFLLEELVRVGDPAAKKGRVILAHFGNGASLAAVRDGVGIDTSMGFTPASGLPMSTRSGDLDPGLVSYFARTSGMTGPQFEHMVNHQSGLIGVSETSSDMRQLLAQEAQDSRAAEAVALFCYQAKKWIGSYAAALGGLDTLVFAGGIGENCPSIRSRICAGLGFLGLNLDEARNAENEAVISTESSPVGARVIRTDEELVIARSTERLLESLSANKVIES